MSTAGQDFSRLLRTARSEISDEWLDAFYNLACALLVDVGFASDGDSKARRRVSQLERLFESGRSPSLRRAAEVHAIMYQLRCVTTPLNGVEIVDYEPLTCVVTEAEANKPVEMLNIDELSKIDRELAYALRSALGPFHREIFQEAEKHWCEKSTLQSLAVNIYMDRHGHLKEDKRERWREKLKRDLRIMRQANLTRMRPSNHHTDEF